MQMAIAPSAVLFAAPAQGAAVRRRGQRRARVEQGASRGRLSNALNSTVQGVRTRSRGCGPTREADDHDMVDGGLGRIESRMLSGEWRNDDKRRGNSDAAMAKVERSERAGAWYKKLIASDEEMQERERAGEAQAGSEPTPQQTGGPF